MVWGLSFGSPSFEDRKNDTRISFYLIFCKHPGSSNSSTSNAEPNQYKLVNVSLSILLFLGSSSCNIEPRWAVYTCSLACCCVSWIRRIQGGFKVCVHVRQALEQMELESSTGWLSKINHKWHMEALALVEFGQRNLNARKLHSHR